MKGDPDAPGRLAEEVRQLHAAVTELDLSLERVRLVEKTAKLAGIGGEGKQGGGFMGLATTIGGLTAFLGVLTVLLTASGFLVATAHDEMLGIPVSLRDATSFPNEGGAFLARSLPLLLDACSTDLFSAAKILWPVVLLLIPLGVSLRHQDRQVRVWQVALIGTLCVVVNVYAVHTLSSPLAVQGLLLESPTAPEPFVRWFTEVRTTELERYYAGALVLTVVAFIGVTCWTHLFRTAPPARAGQVWAGGRLLLAGAIHATALFAALLLPQAYGILAQPLTFPVVRDLKVKGAGDKEVTLPGRYFLVRQTTTHLLLYRSGPQTRLLPTEIVVGYEVTGRRNIFAQAEAAD